MTSGIVDPTFISSLFSYDSLGDDLTNFWSSVLGAGNDPGTSKFFSSSIESVLGGSDLGSDVSTTSTAAAAAATSASSALGNWSTTFSNLGLTGLANFTSWLSTANSNASTAQGNWATTFSNLALADLAHFTSFLSNANSTASSAATAAASAGTNASTGLGYWSTTLSNLSLADITHFTSFLSNTNTTANGAVTTQNSLLSTLFGGTSVGSTLLPAALPNITSAMSTDLTGVLNAIGNALGLGATGNTVAGISTPLVEVLGPCSFRAHSTSTTSTVINSSATAAVYAYPLSLSSLDYNTGGFTQSGNNVTVPVAGLYAVKIGAMFSGATINTGTSAGISPVVEQNGSPARYGGTLALYAGAIASNLWMADSFLIECAAGDVLAPAIYRTNNATVAIKGDAVGASAYFEITLVRKDS